jgi:hypothetical protein
MSLDLSIITFENLFAMYSLQNKPSFEAEYFFKELCRRLTRYEDMFETKQVLPDDASDLEKADYIHLTNALNFKLEKHEKIITDYTNKLTIARAEYNSTTGKRKQNKIMKDIKSILEIIESAEKFIATYR